MTVHFSNSFAADEKAAATKKARRILGMPVALFASLAAVLALGVGAAVAAMLFTSTGSAQAAAYEGKTPTISGEHFSKALYPGSSADLIFTVSNDNPFPVILSKVAASKLDYSPGCGEGGKFLSGPAIAKDSKSAAQVAVDDTIPANGSKVVTVANAVKLDAASEGACSVSVSFVVTSSGAGSGN